MAKPRSAAQKAALRKAQLASARKRRGTGKAVPKKGTGPAKKQSHLRRHGKKYAVAAAAVGAAAGSAYVYKNREKLIVVPAAQRKFLKIAEKKKGRKLKPGEIRHVKMREKRLHARRSIDVVKQRLMLRKEARRKVNRGKSFRPGSKNYFDKHLEKTLDAKAKKHIYDEYRIDVNARARHRLARSKGKKAKGFDYFSGKQVRVDKKGKVRRQRW